jgi:outer membrane protein assembly factor BamB
VWGHPEIWNDAGTGEQILPEMFSMLMRSPQGLGPSGNVPPWTGTTGITEDARIAHFGMASVFRAWNGVLERYGAAISTWEPDDQIAIIGSGRQFKIDEWGRVMGVHFSRVMEAYVACMHAHHPASIVFVEDLKADTLNKYKAVLLVDQWVEMEPELAAALKAAQTAGTKVFYDGTSRESLMAGFAPLGISFDKFENDKHPASDDAAYYRFPRYVQQHLPKLKAALDGAAKPAAIVENPEVWISQLKSDQGRYLFVVNNTTVPLEPGQIWRTTLFSASLLPVVEKVQLTGSAPVVYDVFAMQPVTLQDNGLTADLRSMPARLYAILPSAIDRVTLRGPTKVAAGQAFAWQAQVSDATGKPIRAGVPLRVRLRSADDGLLHEQYVTASAEGAKGLLTVPLNVAAGNVTFEVTELFSGKQSRLNVETARPELPLSLTAPKLANESAMGEAVGKLHPSDTDASDRQFGPHLRDVSILKDGKTAVISAMNWDHNLYGMDLATGEIIWRKKVGNYFAFAPQATSDGFTVQGFDYQSAEGYHLYQLTKTGNVQRRFALYGLPRRLPHRFVPALLNDRQNPVNNFAVPRDGGWVASAGDLGLAVWDSSGKLLWKRDWWPDDRQPARLAALGQDTVLVIKAMVATAYDAKTGEQQWQHKLAATGDVRKVATSSIGTLAAISTTTDGGRVFDLRGDKLRGSKLALTLPAVGEDIHMAAGGSFIVTLNANQLQFFTLGGKGLRWTFTGDDRLRNLRVTTDGGRIAVASELGTVYVLDGGGELVYERDNRALTVPAWTTEGDLLLANWMGNVTLLKGEDFKTKWSVDVRPAATDVRASLTAAETAPTARIADWGNAAKEPLPLTPNLLADTKALIRFVAVGVPHLQLAHKPDALSDGRPEPPQEPWLEWGDVNGLAEANPETYLELDTFRTQLKVTAITFVEDAQHRDSWLRDAALDYWDAAAERWITAQALLSDAAVHCHVLAKPIEASRFRVKIPKGFYGNLRLGEIVLHGEVLGASHPDVIAKRAVATLFDESEQFKDVYPYHDRWSFQLTGAASGGRFWQVNANQMIAPTFYPTFGHTVPTWDFEIVEDPQPGQYRWAQWSWKALSPDVKGATVQIAGLRLHAGVASGEDFLKPHKVADSVPAEWKTVRVDLWELLKQPTKIQTLYLGSSGGPVGFDRILLGRSEAELDKAKESK